MGSACGFYTNDTSSACVNHAAYPVAGIGMYDNIIYNAYHNIIRARCHKFPASHAAEEAPEIRVCGAEKGGRRKETIAVCGGRSPAKGVGGRVRGGGRLGLIYDICERF